jgi:hypothetical protein
MIIAGRHGNAFGSLVINYCRGQIRVWNPAEIRGFWISGKHGVIFFSFFFGVLDTKVVPRLSSKTKPQQSHALK